MAGPSGQGLDGDTIDPGRTLNVHVRPGALEVCVPHPEEDPDLTTGKA